MKRYVTAYVDSYDLDIKMSVVEAESEFEACIEALLENEWEIDEEEIEKAQGNIDRILYELSDCDVAAIEID
jgi:hypothetical protein